MAAVNFTIDGKAVTCERDSLLLDVALANGFEIPTLCHHPAIEPYGACRLCLVEIIQGRWSGLEASCTYPVRDDGIVVRTDSEKVRRYRRLNLELLLGRCPESETVKEMARKLGMEESRLAPVREPGECVLCGLCVAVCQDQVGAGAIGFVGRGHERRVDTPYGEPSEVCIGCGACAEVCPTGCVRAVDDQANKVREIEPFHTRHRLVRCPECGKGYVTEKHLQHLAKRLGDKAGVLEGCPVCRGRRRASELLKAYEKVLNTK
jgi:NADH dehydrogenase/NADH:ubiquinone oxidoreductase subunit G